MAKKRLAVSSVVFNQEEHSYTNIGGCTLSGVTSLLKRQLFKDKYAGIPQHILDKAAERGTKIHEEVSDYINFGKEPTTNEGKAYVTLGIKALASEYLISDEQQYASSIDIVGDDLTLYDIKTTRGGLDKEYVMWQLSCYAYLFEMQNPKHKVKALAGIWLNDDKVEITYVDRIDNNIIQELFEVDSMGLDFVNPLNKVVKIDSANIDLLYNTEEQLAMLIESTKKLEEIKKQVLDSIKESLEEQGMTSFENDRIKITLVGDSEKITFDSKKFKESHPELYSEFTKVSKTKGYVKVTLR